jgi:hypothetical protein
VGVGEVDLLRHERNWSTIKTDTRGQTHQSVLR